MEIYFLGFLLLNISNDEQAVLWSFQTFSTMKLLLAAILLVYLVEADAQWRKAARFAGEAALGQPLDL